MTQCNIALKIAFRNEKRYFVSVLTCDCHVACHVHCVETGAFRRNFASVRSTASERQVRQRHIAHITTLFLST